MTIEKWWRAVGGRKNWNGTLYAALITLMAFKLETTFWEYALFLAGALLGTSAVVAYEDKQRKV